MELEGVISILLGSTFGLVVRMYLKNLSRVQVLSFNNALIVNVLASLFLGIFIAINITNKNFVLFFYVGFLGCLSTFSSFIYELFNLIQKRKYLNLFLSYMEVIALSCIFFCLGYFSTLVFKN